MEIKKDINIFKRIKFFNEYRKVIKSVEPTLEHEFNVRVDYAYRLYTVINIDKDMIGDAYYIKSSDIRRMSEPYIIQYRKELFSFLNEKGLNELFTDYADVQSVGKGSYLMIIGCSTINSVKLFKWKMIGLVSLFVSGLYFLIF